MSLHDDIAAVRARIAARPNSGELLWDDYRRLAEMERERADAAERAIRVRPNYDLRCQECGAPHWFDTVVPSDLWNQIAQREDILCLLCIDKRLIAAGLATDQAEFYFNGKALKSRLYGSDEADALRQRADAAVVGAAITWHSALYGDDDVDDYRIAMLHEEFEQRVIARRALGPQS